MVVRRHDLRLFVIAPFSVCRSTVTPSVLADAQVVQNAAALTHARQYSCPHCTQPAVSCSQ
jgi:hypothetical protein